MATTASSQWGRGVVGWAAWLVLLGCGASEGERQEVASLGRPSVEAPIAGGEAALEADDGLDLGDGFVVWESNRTGAWRLWISALDGADARQLTPDRRRKSHCCPHIAPDGSTIAYLELDRGRARYLDEAAVGELRAIAPEGIADRVLAAPARTYFEHRAAVWVDSERLHYIDGDGAVRLLALASGASSQVLAAPDDLGRRWLVDASGQWAATGRGAFAPVVGRRLGEETPVPGCQPYFARDGRWAFWTAGAGGPIDRFDLATGETATIVRKNDRRLPEGRGYLYFPMLSSDGSLLAFAASGGEHDHFRADYDIFVSEVEPATLNLVGTPRAVSPHPAVDRFPDVWRPQSSQARPAPDPAPVPEFRARWPARSDGLVWSWSVAGEGPTTALRQDDEPIDVRMPLDLGGGLVVAQQTATLLHQGLQRTNQFTIELLLTPPEAAPSNFGAILAIGRDRSRENLVFGQRGDRLTLRLRVGPKGAGAYAEADLGRVAAGRRQHLMIAYSPGRATVYRNGEEALRSRDLRGHFFQWRPYAMTLGDRAKGGAPWTGQIEAAAIYDRPLGANEARANAERLLGGL